MKRTQKVSALLSLALALLAWGSAPVFIRVMRNAYDPYSQAFIRYFFGAAALTAFCLVAHRSEFLRLLRHPGPLLGIACINTTHQLTWTIGCYRAPATLAQLIVQVGVVFVILFSFLLFHEERRVIRSLRFLGGTVLSFAGMAVVLTGGGHAGGAIDGWTAVLLLIPALCFAVYVVWAKHLMMNCHPIPMFAVLAIFITLGTGIVAVVCGRPACLIEASTWITLIAFVSGLLPLAAGHPAFHYAQKHLGSAFSSRCNILSPVLTYLFASIFLDDTPLTPFQWAGAVTLLSGTMMVVRADSRSSKTAAGPS